MVIHIREKFYFPSTKVLQNSEGERGGGESNEIHPLPLIIQNSQYQTGVNMMRMNIYSVEPRNIQQVYEGDE